MLNKQIAFSNRNNTAVYFATTVQRSDVFEKAETFHGGEIGIQTVTSPTSKILRTWTILSSIKLITSKANEWMCQALARVPKDCEYLAIPDKKASEFTGLDAFKNLKILRLSSNSSATVISKQSLLMFEKMLDHYGSDNLVSVEIHRYLESLRSSGKCQWPEDDTVYQNLRRKSIPGLEVQPPTPAAAPISQRTQETVPPNLNPSKNLKVRPGHTRTRSFNAPPPPLDGQTSTEWKQTKDGWEHVDSGRWCDASNPLHRSTNVGPSKKTDKKLTGHQRSVSWNGDDTVLYDNPLRKQGEGNVSNRIH